jgi:hypothetical protein
MMHLHGKQCACDICGDEFEGNALESHAEFPGLVRADVCPRCVKTRNVEIVAGETGQPVLVHWAKGTPRPTASPPGDPPFPGVSAEVIKEHASRHGCTEGAADERMCPCGNAVVIVCGQCEEAVFVCARPGTWCEHMTELTGMPGPGSQ